MHGGDVYRHEVLYDFSVNSNPLGIPEHIKQVLEEAIALSEQYPDPIQETLVNALAEKYHRDSAEMILGNGASELFLALIHALQPKKMIIPVPSFSGYETACRACDGNVVFYQMKSSDSFTLTQQFLEVIEHDVDLIFLANPNNPTGAVIPQQLLWEILKKAEEKGVFVVLDECFLEFTKEEKETSMIAHLAQFPHLFVVRAFTKIYAIPGVRLGYGLTGNRMLAQALKKHLPEWNISMFAQCAGVAALQQTEYVARTVAEVEIQRNVLQAQLTKMGIQVFPSQSNFVLFYDEVDWYEKLLQKKILIRDCSDYQGLRKGYYRVAVQNQKKNEILVKAMQEIKCAGESRKDLCV